MYKVFFALMLCLSANIFADSSLLSISEEKVQLNPERLSFKEGAILLETDTHGLIELGEVTFDGQDYFCGNELFGGVYTCTSCEWMGDHRPVRCTRCGGTEFRLSDATQE